MSRKLNENELVDLLMAYIDTLERRLDILARRSQDNRFMQWVDTKEACDLLRVTSRTLHTYRDKGLLPYSQIGSKFYYRLKDIKELREFNSKPNQR